MSLLKKVADGMLYKGGMLGTGILGVLLWKGRYLPEYTGAISFCATSVGFCGVVWHIWRAGGKKHVCSKECCAGIIEVLYREIMSKMEELSQQETAQTNEGKDGKRLAPHGLVTDGREQEYRPFADHGEGSNENKIYESSEGESAVSRNADCLKKCAEIFRKHATSNAQAGEEDGTNEHYVDPSKVLALADKVDEAASRVLKIKELQLLTGGLPKNLFRETEGDISDERKGEVFQASQLFKDWDTKRFDIEKELSSLTWRGKRSNILKPVTKRLRHKSGKKFWFDELE